MSKSGASLVEEWHSVAAKSQQTVTLKWLGNSDYLETQGAMKRLVDSRDVDVDNQIWLLEHPSVYTQGTSCNQQTLIPSDIPIVKSDRGGQITYHGPGQLVLYPILRLREFGISVKGLVEVLEQSVINLLAEYGIEGCRREGAPGVYVSGAKIAALGLRIKRGISYHGLSFNVDMDMSPFSNIDPCGFEGLRVSQLKTECALTLGDSPPLRTVGNKLSEHLLRLL